MRCASRSLIDGRNVLDPGGGARLGFIYEGVGRPDAGEVEH